MILNRRFSHGFSIAELLVVMALLSVAAGSYPLGLVFLRKYQAIEAAEEVASRIQSARRAAVKSNSQTGMLLSFGYPDPQGLYLVIQDKPRVRDRLQAVSPPSPPSGLPASGVTFRLPPGFQFESPVGPFNSLIFRSDGTVQGFAVTDAVEGLIGLQGMHFVLKIKQISSGLSQTLLIGRSGQVVIS